MSLLTIFVFFSIYGCGGTMNTIEVEDIFLIVIFWTQYNMQALKCFMKIKNNHIFFYIWYLFLVTFKLYKKNDLYIKSNKNYNILWKIWYNRARARGRRRPSERPQEPGGPTHVTYYTIQTYALMIPLSRSPARAARANTIQPATRAHTRAPRAPRRRNS